MEYITRKKPIIYVASQFSIPTCKGRYQSDGTERRDDKKDTSRQLLAGLNYFARYIWFYLAELDDSNAEIVQIYRKCFIEVLTMHR